jgi:hypothetical protein
MACRIVRRRDTGSTGGSNGQTDSSLVSGTDCSITQSLGRRSSCPRTSVTHSSLGRGFSWILKQSASAGSETPAAILSSCSTGDSAISTNVMKVTRKVVELRQWPPPPVTRLQNRVIGMMVDPAPASSQPLLYSPPSATARAMAWNRRDEPVILLSHQPQVVCLSSCSHVVGPAVSQAVSQKERQKRGLTWITRQAGCPQPQHQSLSVSWMRQSDVHFDAGRQEVHIVSSNVGHGVHRSHSLVSATDQRSSSRSHAPVCQAVGGSGVQRIRSFRD